ncbi:MAG: flippase [Elusimicrobiaceae bacterium]|nr:flippase [Elusimicrobiaceae bacterium]
MNAPANTGRTLTQKVVSNTAFNLLGKAWSILIALFLTPYIVGRIGVDRYGIWALVSVVTEYFGLLDLGIGSSYVKFIAEYYTTKSFDKINGVVNSGLVFYLGFTAVSLTLAYLFQDRIIGLCNIPPELEAETLFAFWTGLLTFCVVNAASSFVAVQSGLQRMDIYNKVSVAISLPRVAGTIWALENGYGLRGLILVNAFAMLLAGIINAAAAFRLLPQLELSVRHFRKDVFMTLLGYGSKLQVARVSSTISVTLDKLLLTHYLSVGLVTFFQLASTVIEQAKSLPILLMQALIPAFSELDARGDRAKVCDSYIRGTRYMTLLAMPLFTFLIADADQLMLLWMGPGYEKSAAVIRILAVGWGLAVIAGVRSVVLQAIAKPGIEMNAGLIAAVFNIPLSIFFIRQMGFTGVALGTTVALAMSVMYGFYGLNRELGLPAGFYIKALIPQGLALCAGAGALAWASALAASAFCGTGRMGAFLVLALSGLVFCAAYIALLARFKPFDKADCLRIEHAFARIPARFVKLFARREPSGL